MAPNDQKFTELSHFDLDRGSIRKLALSFCQKNGVVVLDKFSSDPDEPVSVGMVRPDDANLLRHSKDITVAA